MTLPAGYRLGPYEVAVLLGAGGMGEVYRARDTRLGRDVALKVLPRAASDDPERLRRFEDEARAAAALSHPHILAVYDVGSHDGSPYIVSELLEGATVREALSAGGLTVHKALEIAISLARALEAAHEKGIIHRDIKPENVFLTRNGHVKVLDFGLARFLPSSVDEVTSDAPTATQQTVPGAVLGTAAYMSPEQVRGKAADARSDIFSLGVMLYEMLARRRPFQGETKADTAAAILDRDPASLEDLDVPVSPPLAQIVRRCLEKRPEDRFHSAHDLAIALEAVGVTPSGKGTLSAGSHKTRPRYSWRTRLAVAAAAFVVLSAVGIRLWPGRRLPSRAPIKSLVVLPLKNLSGDPAQDFFAEGMHEALTTAVSKIGALRVISRTSAMHYKGSDKALPEIAAELNVDAVVEGSVLQSGDHVRVTAQLIQAATDAHLWAESYDRSLRDVLSIHDEVARAIADRVSVVLTAEEDRALSRSRPVDPEAYRQYLLGQFHLEGLSGESMRESLDHYRAAIARDPAYAPAYAGLSFAYTNLGVWFGSMSPREVLPLARTAARRALELDHDLPDGYLALGVTQYMFEWDWAGAASSFRRGIALNTRSTAGRIGFANYLTAMGHFEESIRLGKETLEIDPLSPSSYNELAFSLQNAGRVDEALEYARKGFEVDPTYLQTLEILAELHELRHEPAEAIEYLGKAEKLIGSGTAQMGYVAFLYGRLQRHAEAQGILDKVKARSHSQFVWPNDFAGIYIGLGDQEAALGWLEKAYEEREPALVFLKVSRVYDSLRKESRFQRLLERMNFPQ